MAEVMILHHYQSLNAAIQSHKRREGHRPEPNVKPLYDAPEDFFSNSQKAYGQFSG